MRINTLRKTIQYIRIKVFMNPYRKKVKGLLKGIKN